MTSRNVSETIRAYLCQIGADLTNLPVETIERIVQVLQQVRDHRRQVFLFGNGGSAANASHFASGLAKGTIVSGKPRIRAIALTDDMALVSAWANDTSYANVFAQQLENLIEPGDAVIGISGSSNSPNVPNALKLARTVGATTIRLTGFDGAC